jgi:hypothetical protein
MSIVRTKEEFSSRRKYTYGGDLSSSSPKPVSTLGSGLGSLSSSRNTASFSPHKNYYGRDQDNSEVYVIEFNIGKFNFDEITIRTEGNFFS